MASRTEDFMLEEYKQIANAYQDLHAQHNELVKFYLTIVAVPASVLALVSRIMSDKPIDPNSFFASIEGLIAPTMFILLFTLILIGVAVLLALINTRLEALLYVRTVNCVRRYFIEHDPQRDIKKYLKLPDYDLYPKYWEGPGHRSFWNVVMVVILNSAIAVVIFVIIFTQFSQCVPQLITFGILIFLLASVSQMLLYKKLCENKEKNYQVKFPTSSSNEYRIGIDLDGVLGDLALEVVKAANSKFGIEIKVEEITSHNLTECTALTSEQVNELFTTGNVFETMMPVLGSREALKLLRKKGYIVHILTDRFWSNRDWSISNAWLNENNIEWDHLNLVRAKEKSEYAQAQGIFAFIEDKLETAVDLSSVCKTVFLLDRPYNQGVLPKNVLRVSKWREITDILTGSLKE